MRPQTTYLRKDLTTGDVAVKRFKPVDFRTVGLMPAMASGIPQLEAYQLVNQWNIEQQEQRFVFGLEV